MAAMLALTWLGCGPDQSVPDSAPEPPERPRCTGALGARVGECARPLSLPTSDGGTFSLEDHLGEVVVVHVASTGAALDPDASAFLALQLAERGDFVALSALAVDPVSPPLEAADAASWKETLQLPFPVAWDASERMARDWADTSLFPTLLVLDSTGEIVARIHEQFEGQLPPALEMALP